MYISQANTHLTDKTNAGNNTGHYCTALTLIVRRKRRVVFANGRAKIQQQRPCHDEYRRRRGLRAAIPSSCGNMAWFKPERLRATYLEDFHRRSHDVVSTQSIVLTSLCTAFALVGRWNGEHPKEDACIHFRSERSILGGVDIHTTTRVPVSQADWYQADWYSSGTAVCILKGGFDRKMEYYDIHASSSENLSTHVYSALHASKTRTLVESIPQS